MPTVPALLKQLEALHRQHVALESEIAEVERQIIGSARQEPTARPKRPSAADVVELVKATVKLLRDAGEPLPRLEIAKRLGISRSAAQYRLRKALDAKFVEKAGGGRYRVSNAVPVILP